MASCQRVKAYAILIVASLVLQLFHLLLFSFTFCTGIIVEVLFYYFQKIFYETQSPLGLESLITLVIVGIGATVAVDKSKKANESINALAITHPVLFFTIPNAVCIMIFVFCFGYTSNQFFVVESSAFGILHENIDTSGAYLLCTSFIVYVVTSICYKDRNYIRDRIFGNDCYQFIAFIINCLLQAATVFMIFKPILEILKKNLIRFDYEPIYIFGYMLLLGLVMGMASGAIEKYAHCVVHKRKAPFYWYENSVEARNCILQFLAFPIHYGFFKPNKILPIDPTEEHFIYFSTCASLALLQFTKILYLIIFDHKNLDVVCGYSPRTSARSRLSNNRRRSRSPRVFSFRSTATADGRQESTQHYEGHNTEQPDRNNNSQTENKNPPRPVNKLRNKTTREKNRDSEVSEVKLEKALTSFAGLLFPVEMPVIFLTRMVYPLVIKFVSYATGINSSEETVPEQIAVGINIGNNSSQGDGEQPHCSSTVRNAPEVPRTASRTISAKSTVVNVEEDRLNANIGDSGEHVNVTVHYSGDDDKMGDIKEPPINSVTVITTTIEQ